MQLLYKYEDDMVEVDYDVSWFRNDRGVPDFEVSISHIWFGNADLISNYELYYKVLEEIEFRTYNNGR